MHCLTDETFCAENAESTHPFSKVHVVINCALSKFVAFLRLETCHIVQVPLQRQRNWRCKWRPRVSKKARGSLSLWEWRLCCGFHWQVLIPGALIHSLFITVHYLLWCWHMSHESLKGILSFPSLVNYSSNGMIFPSPAPLHFGWTLTALLSCVCSSVVGWRIALSRPSPPPQQHTKPNQPSSSNSQIKTNFFLLSG